MDKFDKMVATPLILKAQPVIKILNKARAEKLASSLNFRPEAFQTFVFWI